jgi:hypothetical protein
MWRSRKELTPQSADILGTVEPHGVYKTWQPWQPQLKSNFPQATHAHLEYTTSAIKNTLEVPVPLDIQRGDASSPRLQRQPLPIPRRCNSCCKIPPRPTTAISLRRIRLNTGWSRVGIPAKQQQQQQQQQSSIYAYKPFNLAVRSSGQLGPRPLPINKSWAPHGSVLLLVSNMAGLVPHCVLGLTPSSSIITLNHDITRLNPPRFTLEGSDHRQKSGFCMARSRVLGTVSVSGNGERPADECAEIPLYRKCCTSPRPNLPDNLLVAAHDSVTVEQPIGSRSDS